MKQIHSAPPDYFVTSSKYRSKKSLGLDVVGLAFYVFLFWAFFVYLDPFYTGYGAFRVTRDIGPLKYIGLFFGVIAGFLALIGIRLRDERMPAELIRAFKAGLPLFYFAGFILAGSAYARFSVGIQETFLGVGLAILGFPLAILLFHGCLQGARVINVFVGVLMACCLYIIPMIVMKRIEGGQAFHTEIFLVIPLCVFYFLQLRSRSMAWAVLLLMIATALALHKNLGYLLLVGSLTYLYAIHIQRYPFKATSIVRLLVIYFSFVAALIISGVLAFLLMNREEYLPSGNIEVRLEVYTFAINKFFASPIWGDFFTESSLVYLKAREVLGRDHVTTHSDWLDVLSHGGLLGASLYVLAHAVPFRRAWIALRKAPVSPEVNALHGLLAISIGGVVVGMFVSLFTSPAVATLYWFNLGLITALTARIETMLSSDTTCCRNDAQQTPGS